MKILTLKISLFVMGLSSITAQIILLRELLVSFLGNELTLGIILASWLILVAAGSFLIGKSVENVERKLEIFAVFQLIFSIAFPFAIFFCRIFKNILLATPGEALGFGPIFYSSLLILLPLTVPYGALFTYGCKLYAQYSEENAASIGKVYIIETMGSMIGGLLITFLLIQYLNPFTIAFSISLLNSLMALFLLWRNPASSKTSSQKALIILSILLSLLFAYGLLPQNTNRIHQSSIRSQWRGLNVIHYENSIYGNITVTKRGEQYTFFADGVPSITTPVPDIASIEDFVHFPMLFHEKPESILILNGGAGGMIHEILKYPVKHVDYVELDPVLLKLIQEFPTPLTQSELSDKRVKIHYTDGRLFVQRTGGRFDIIFIGLSAPQSLQTNRLFSSEFFSMAKEKMNPNGILVLTLPGSLTYISPELRDLNGCILDTLKNVYRHVRIIPGDVNLYLASDSDSLENLSSNEISKRFEEKQIQASLITKNYIGYRLNERWLQWFAQSMEGRKIAINSDFHPLAVFFNLSYWNSLFSPYLTDVFKWYERSSLALSITKIILITVILGTLFIKVPRLSIHSITYSILTTGLTGMIFNLAIIFAFQTLYGYLYHQIGFLIAIFMLGIASGSFLITKRLGQIKKRPLLFLKTEIAIILFSVLFPFLLLIPAHHLENKMIYFFLYGVVLIMSFLSGMSIGLQFPLATKIYLSSFMGKRSLGETAGLLYAADLLGGFFGGLVGGILLLPILGLKQSCLMMAIIKTSSFVLFLVFMKTAGNTRKP
ncbi:MAG: fused MFS/spermidine synthase [Thermodesulfobacteriota bacterium]